MPNATIKDILKLLKSAYGKPANGHELLLKFYDLFQRENETSSKYLQRLQSLLRRVIDSGEVLLKREFETLVKQFQRGCKDDTTLHQLNIMVPLDKFEYTDFTELFCALVEEEERVEDRRHRFSETATVCKAQTATDKREISELKDKVAALSLKLEEVSFREKVPTPNFSGTNPNISHVSQGRGRGQERSTYDGYRRRSKPPSPFRRALICYNCGERGHSFRDCSNPPNPVRVCESLKLSNTQGNGMKPV